MDNDKTAAIGGELENDAGIVCAALGRGAAQFSIRAQNQAGLGICAVPVNARKIPDRGVARAVSIDPENVSEAVGATGGGGGVENTVAPLNGRHVRTSIVGNAERSQGLIGDLRDGARPGTRKNGKQHPGNQQEAAYSGECLHGEAVCQFFAGFQVKLGVSHMVLAQVED